MKASSPRPPQTCTYYTTTHASSNHTSPLSLGTQDTSTSRTLTDTYTTCTRSPRRGESVAPPRESLPVTTLLRATHLKGGQPTPQGIHRVRTQHLIAGKRQHQLHCLNHLIHPTLLTPNSPPHSSCAPLLLRPASCPPAPGLGSRVQGFSSRRGGGGDGGSLGVSFDWRRGEGVERGVEGEQGRGGGRAEEWGGIDKEVRERGRGS